MEELVIKRKAKIKSITLGINKSKTKPSIVISIKVQFKNENEGNIFLDFTQTEIRLSKFLIMLFNITKSKSLDKITNKNVQIGYYNRYIVSIGNKEGTEWIIFDEFFSGE